VFTPGGERRGELQPRGQILPMGASSEVKNGPLEKYTGGHYPQTCSLSAFVNPFLAFLTFSLPAKKILPLCRLSLHICTYSASVDLMFTKIRQFGHSKRQVVSVLHISSTLHTFHNIPSMNNPNAIYTDVNEALEGLILGFFFFHTYIAKLLK
jgi:hypothetical protein